jgi:hypothetical protein
MSTALRNEDSPLDAKLESVIPGINAWHSQTLSRLTQVEDGVNKLNEGLKKLDNTVSHNSLAKQQQDMQFIRGFLQNMSNQISLMSSKIMPNDTTDQSGFGLTLATQSDNVEGDADAPTMDSTNSEVTFHMQLTHASLPSLWNEWFGEGPYQDIEGGIHGRNNKHGSKWRQHFNKQRYSRTCRIIKAIEHVAKDSGLSGLDAARQLDNIYQEVNRSLIKSVEVFQKKGYLTKMKKRGKQA